MAVIKGYIADYCRYLFNFGILYAVMRRFFEILIPSITWGLITLPIWLSPFHPAVVAYFIILFDVYFFYKSLKTVVLATVSYINVDKSRQVDWLAKVKSIEDFRKIKHFFIVPNYRESYAKVKKTLEQIANQKYPNKQLYIVLALEEAEGKAAVKRYRQLAKHFKNRFAGFWATYHRLEPGEEKGKASNEAFAAKKISRWVAKQGLDPLDILITSCDADALVDKQYCAYLTTNYLLDQNGRYHFYASPVVLYNNYWHLNFIIRLQTTISSILRLSLLSDKNNLIQISTYSMSLWLLESVGYWDVDIIPEDWHLFLQAFFKHGQKVQTVPIYLLCTRDGVRGKNWRDTFKSRYEQERRWAWGVSDIPYAMEQVFKSKHIRFLDKFFRLLGIIESHIFWPVSFFLLTLGATIPGLVNPYFKRTVMGYLLPEVAGAIVTLSVLFVLVIAYLDFQAKHRLMKMKKIEARNFPYLVIQWLLFPVLSPVISAFLSSLPALESHTRLLLGKKLNYKVTRKV